MAAEPKRTRVDLDEFENSDEEIVPARTDSPSPKPADSRERSPASPKDAGPDAEEDEAPPTPEDQPEDAPASGDEDEDEDDDEDIALPPITRTLIKRAGHIVGSDHLLLLKTSSAIGIQIAPFSRASYNPASDAHDDAAVIRWRMRSSTEKPSTRTTVSDLSSNARVVVWEDGSETLHVGSEAFLLTEDPLPADSPLHLFQRQAQIQVCEGRLAAKAHLRPFTRRKRVLTASERMINKNQGVLISDTLVNPEREEREALRSAAEKERLRNRQEAMRRRQEMRRLEAAASRRPGAMARYLEDNDEGDYADEDEEDEAEETDEDEDEEYERRRSASRRRQREENVQELNRRRREQEDPDRLMRVKRGSDETGVKRTKPESKKRRKLMLSDDSDDEDEESEE